MTCQPLKIKALICLERLKYIKSTATQRNIPEDQNPGHKNCGNLKSQTQIVYRLPITALTKLFLYRPGQVRRAPGG